MTRRRVNISHRLLSLGVLLFFVRERADAQYIDPGTGSYLLQLLLAGFLSMLFYLKRIRDPLKAFFKNLFSEKDESRPEEKAGD